MPVGANLIGKLKDELGDNPVVSNVVFAFLLAGVEKMLEVEFACACDPKWNKLCVVPFFLIPAFTASLLMLLIHGVSEKKNENENENKKWRKLKRYSKIFLFSVLPFIVWMALMLLNGDYYVCGYSNWPGRFVTADQSSLKWCEPANTTTQEASEKLTYSHDMYIRSQVRTHFIVFVLENFRN